MAETFDLAVTQGETFNLAIRYKVGEDYQSFTGRTVKAQVRIKEYNRSQMLLDLTPYVTKESSGEPDTPAEDRLRITIPADVTAVLDAKRWSKGAYWDIFAIAENDPADSWLILQGAATLDPAVTQTVED